MDYKLHHGDCLDVLPTLASNSVDSIVTDPPYEISFMSKKWDASGIAYSVDVWRECLRIAKPGAMLLAFGGDRTHHRLMCAIEDAGWELRTCVYWVFGSGMPKSLDVGKAIDRAAGVERETLMTYGRSGRSGGIMGKRVEITRNITAPATPAAATWDGWGTGLKPAAEIICVAMKKTDGTFAQNAQTHGVAGFWVDGGRIPITDGATMARNNRPGENGWKNSSGGANNAARHGEPSGRWPSTLIHDGSEQVVELFPETNARPHGPGIKASSMFGTIPGHPGFLDTGSAARFFYTAKAGKYERALGLPTGAKNKHNTVKPLDLLQYLCKLTRTPTGGVVLDLFMGSGTTGQACALTGRDFIGIEQDAEHYATAQQRIEYVYAKMRGGWTMPAETADTEGDYGKFPLFAGVEE